MNTIAISAADTKPLKNRIAFKQTTSQTQPIVAQQPAPIMAPQAAPQPAPTVPAPSVASKPKDMSKTVAIASSALAVASAGLAAYAIVKSRNAGAFKGQLEELSRQVTENKQTAQQTVQQLAEMKNSFLGGLDEAKAHIGTLRGEVQEAKAVAEKAQNPIIINKETVVTKPLGMQTRPVSINGLEMELPTVMHGYGEAEEKLTNQLRSESTKRILGIKRTVTPTENPVIHFLSSELTGLYKAGGLAIVPRELIANLIAHAHGTKGVGHLPLYTGPIENNATLSLKKQKDGTYKYVKTIIDSKDPSKNKEMTLATVRKSHDVKTDIYTDTGVTKETCGVYETVGSVTQAVSYEETILELEKHDKKLADTIRSHMEFGKDYETETLKFTAPKPLRVQIQLEDGRTINEGLEFEEFLGDLNPKQAKEMKERLNNGCVCEIPWAEYTENPGNQLRHVPEEHRAKLSEAIEINQGAVSDGKKVKAVVKFLPEEPPKAEAKFKLQFYEHDKFNLSGPKMNGTDRNMYTNTAHQSGETERFVYFNKFVYENMFNKDKLSANPDPVDMIIGNDWHTGPLSAMIRLLTPARAAFGEIDSASAEKLQNTPIITIMHNFKLNGSANHSQDKLLSVMFGEHTAKIAENAWMPQNANLPMESWNGLFHGHSFNPQGQAMAYSDEVIFVSKGNAKEATTVKEKGGINYWIASLRAGTHDYTIDKKKEIARDTGLNLDEISFNPTAKGITNGCDRVNNILTKAKARILEKNLDLKEGSLISEEVAIKNPFMAHQHNKKVVLEQRIKADIETAKRTNGKENPMCLYDFEHTDLTGVTVDTPVIGQAGRIVDQKGIDIYVAGYEELIKSGNYDKNNPPILWLNGKGDKQFIDKFLEAKTRIREIDPVAADRMICSGNFGEPGRYDAAKTIFDFSGMSSWDEPCGLVQKEIGYFSGAIPIVNEVGGLTDGLIGFKKGADNSKANAFFVKFMDKDTHSYEEAISHNAKAWADAMSDALKLYKDKDAFGQGIKNSYLARHDWAHGKTQEYVDAGKRIGVFTPNVDSDFARFATAQAA